MYIQFTCATLVASECIVDKAACLTESEFNCRRSLNNCRRNCGRFSFTDISAATSE